MLAVTAVAVVLALRLALRTAYHCGWRDGRDRAALHLYELLNGPAKGFPKEADRGRT